MVHGQTRWSGRLDYKEKLSLLFAYQDSGHSGTRVKKLGFLWGLVFCLFVFSCLGFFFFLLPLLFPSLSFSMHYALWISSFSISIYNHSITVTFTVDQMEISGDSSLTSNESSGFVSGNLESWETWTLRVREKECADKRVLWVSLFRYWCKTLNEYKIHPWCYYLGHDLTIGSRLKNVHRLLSC